MMLDLDDWLQASYVAGYVTGLSCIFFYSIFTPRG